MLANHACKTKFTDLCCGYNAFWRELVPVLDLPDTHGPSDESVVDGDGFEIETVIDCRFDAADVTVREVASVELSRIHGESNLRAFPDGARVLWTIAAERKQHRLRKRVRMTATPLHDAPGPPKLVGNPSADARARHDLVRELDLVPLDLDQTSSQRSFT